eukprot:gene919-1161_t
MKNFKKFHIYNTTITTTTTTTPQTFASSYKIFIDNDNNKDIQNSSRSNFISGSSNPSDVQNHCNQNTIIKDWGFRELASTYEPVNPFISPIWRIEQGQINGSNPFDLSFIKELPVQFSNTQPYGFNALKITNIDDGLESFSSISINQTITLPLLENTDNFVYYLTFYQSCQDKGTQVHLTVDTLTTLLPASNAKYSQNRVRYAIPSYLYNSTNEFVLSIQIVFPTTSFFSYYIIDDLHIYSEFQLYELKHEVNYVSPHGSDQNGSGTRENPFSSVMGAVRRSKQNGIIHLLPGIYCGLGNSWIDFNGLNLTVRSTNPFNPAILSGEGQLSIVTYESWVALARPQLVKFEGLIFQNPSTGYNGGAVVVSGTTSLTFINCTFQQSKSDNFFILNYLMNVNFTQCIFKDSINNTVISILGVYGNETLIIFDSVFEAVYPLDILKINTISIQYTNFSLPLWLPIQSEISCSIMVDTVSDIQVYQTFLGVPICTTHSTVLLKNCYMMTLNGVNTFSIGILSQNSDLTIEKSYLSLFGLDTALLAYKGTLNIRKTSFIGTMSAYSIQVISGNLTLQSSTLQNENQAVYLEDSISYINNCSLITTNSFLYSIQSTIYLFNSKFYGSASQSPLIFSVLNAGFCTYTKSTNTFYYLISSTLNEINAVAEHNKFTYLEATQNSTFMVSGIFQNNQKSNLFILQDWVFGSILDSTFYFNGGPSGPIATTSDLAMIAFENTVFFGNQASNYGGCFVLYDNSRLSLKNCTGEGNRAQVGGVVASLGLNVSVMLNQGIYTNNTAFEEGGFMYYTSVPPIIDGAVIHGNFELFGGDIALGRASLYFSEATNEILSKPFDSGQTTFDIVVQLTDSYGNNITNKFCQEECFLYLFINGNLQSFVPILSAGEGIFHKVTMYGSINSTEQLMINSNEDTISPISIQIKFNPCDPGFIPNSNGTACLLCGYNTYGIDGKTCLQCPANAHCNGTQIYSDQDYWIDFSGSSQTNHVAYPCQPGVCTGNNTCEPEYQGPLCAECIPGYFNCGAGCKYKDSVNKIVLTIKLIIFFALVLFQQLSNDSSGLVNIALYFLQTLVVLSSGIKFSVLSIFSGSGSTHSGGKNTFLSYLNDCVGPFDFYWNHYFILGQPICLLIILAIVILFEFLFRKSRIIFKIPIIKDLVHADPVEFRNRQFSAFIKVCFNSYGPFITEVLLILFCHQVGSYSLLNANLAVQCLGGQYSIARDVSWGLFPIIVLFPMTILVLLYRQRTRLSDPNVQRKLGVFYLKYKPPFYFWDVITLLKRVFIVTLSLLQYDSSERSISLVIVCFASLFLQIKYQPFLSSKDNNLETISLTLLFISCIYLDNGLWEATEQWILIISIVIFVVAALKLQGQYYLNEFKAKILPKLTTIYQNLTGCCKSKSSSLADKNIQFSYDEGDDEDDEDENSSLYNVVGKVDLF